MASQGPQQQQQQQQQQAAVSAGGQVGGQGQPPSQTAPPTGMRGEFNSVSVCKLGQEAVQDIVAKTNDIFSIMKAMQLPNGVTPVNPQHQAKLVELTRNVQKQFQRLRLLYVKCNQLSGAMDQSNAEELIPWKDGQDSLRDLSSLGSEEKVEAANREKQELIEKVRSKNQQLLQIIERVRSLIWDINTMMAMRHTAWL